MCNVDSFGPVFEYEYFLNIFFLNISEYEYFLNIFFEY